MWSDVDFKELLSVIISDFTNAASFCKLCNLTSNPLTLCLCCTQGGFKTNPCRITSQDVDLDDVEAAPSKQGATLEQGELFF